MYVLVLRTYFAKNRAVIKRGVGSIHIILRIFVFFQVSGIG